MWNANMDCGAMAEDGPDVWSREMIGVMLFWCREVRIVFFVGTV